MVDDTERDTAVLDRTHTPGSTRPTHPPDPLRAFLVTLLALVVVAFISFAIATMAKWRMPDEEPDVPSMSRTARTWIDPRRPSSRQPEPPTGAQVAGPVGAS